MKAYEIRDDFGLDNLVLTERPEPTCGPGQVKLALKAMSLNFRDFLMVTGRYNRKQRLPLVPLSDGVGDIVEVGSGVERVQVGDRVAGIFAQEWLAGEPSREKLATTLGGPLDGMLAERVVLDAHGVVRVPEHLSDVEAATLPCAGLTAWSALVTQGGVKAGDRVLTLGTGGVSHFAVLFAKLLGAEVIVTSSSDAKLERAQRLGADHGINYSTHPDWDRELKARTARRGVDHVVEVGGAGTFERSSRALRPGGTMSLIGVLAGGQQSINLVPILMQNIRIQGVLVGHREAFEAMNRAIDLHRLRPVVDHTFSFDRVPEAFAYLAKGRHFGKLCIEL